VACAPPQNPILVGVGVMVGVRVGVGVDGTGHPLSASFTAWMISATVTSTPLGTPCGHAEGWAGEGFR